MAAGVSPGALCEVHLIGCWESLSCSTQPAGRSGCTGGGAELQETRDPGKQLDGGARMSSSGSACLFTGVSAEV